LTTRFVLDTGALIGAEKGKKRALDYIGLAARGHAELITPVVCVVEWWRGRTDRREMLLRSIIVHPLSIEAAKAAGVGLAALGSRIDSRLSIDAAVMAFAALHDAPVITSDIDDLTRFKPIFPSVRLLTM
jgi:predicted nucleic acid-binding protein